MAVLDSSLWAPWRKQVLHTQRERSGLKVTPKFYGKALMLKKFLKSLCSKGAALWWTRKKQQKCQRGNWTGPTGARGSWENRIQGKTLNMGLSLKILLLADLAGCKVCSLSLAGSVLLRDLGNPIMTEISCNSEFKHQQEVTETTPVAGCSTTYWWGCLENTGGWFCIAAIACSSFQALTCRFFRWSV